MNGRAALSSAVLWAQRRNLRVPRPVARMVYALFGRPAAARSMAPAEGFPEPLAPEPVATGALVAQPASPAVRCLLVTDVLDAGGIDEILALLARGLPGHGVATAVLYSSGSPRGRPGPGSRLAHALAADGVPVAKVSAADGPRWIADHRPDVISAHGAADWVLDTAQSLGIPFVDTLHNCPNATDLARGRRVTGLVAVSDVVRRQYLAADPLFPPERIVTVDNRVDPGRLRPADRARARDALGLRDEFLFLCLGRHAAQKNQIGLIRAFADVARAWPAAHLLVAGGVEDPLYLEQERRLRDRAAHASARIHLRGPCPWPAALLAAADAFVLDSFFEGGPIASIEALIAGLPVVITDVGAARAQLGPDGQRGYVVPNPLGEPARVDAAAVRAARYRRHANHDALVSAMGAVIRDRAHWAGARNGLRAESLRRFDPDDCVRAHARVLARAAAGVPVLAAPVGER
jgi:glycosyltransferase involved in cell wall biosynthesis